MKILQSGAMLALFAACYLPASAQKGTPPINEPNYNKARVFNDVPEKMSLRLTDMDAVLDLPIGAKVNTSIANNFTIVGTVISKSDPVDGASKSIVIKAINRKDAIFTFTRFKKTDGSFGYSGRIINNEAGDALEITKEGDGYVMKKKGFYDMISE
jgi:hypothetical protein